MGILVSFRRIWPRCAGIVVVVLGFLLFAHGINTLTY
jgi:hypothetical protein